MNWEWAKAQLFEGKTVCRESERRDLNGAYVRGIGREGVKAMAGFDLDCKPCFMLVGTMSQVPIECSAEDINATDWALE